MSILEDRRGDVLVLTMENPSAANALTREAATAIHDRLRDCSLGGDVAAMVITGAGRAFCAGFDLTEVRQEESMGDNLRRWFGPLAMALHASRFPVVAAVNGAVAGLGLSLALACHARVASRSAVFAGAFLQVGLIPDGGASYFLSRILGAGPAYRWISSGERLDADAACRLGLADLVVDDGEVVNQAVDLARSFATHDPLAASEVYRLLHDATGLSLPEVIEREARIQDELGRREVFRRARDAFLERRRNAR
ncbi:MAG: enoyl-CoA hydratase/isomerase family protein [Actinomycetota bacterium]